MANRIRIIVDADTQKASKNVSDFTGSLDKNSGSAGKLGATLGSLGVMLGRTTVALGATAAAGLTAGTVLGFQFNSSVEQSEAKLMAFIKDNEQVAKTLAWVKNEAAQTQFSFTDMADAAANLTPVAKSSGQSLQDLIKQAEILAALNPAEGLTGATFALREALSGDWVSIVDRFNLPRKRINELKEQGVPAMEIISKTLNEMGIDYGLVAKQGQTVSARFDQIKDKLTMMAGAATKPIFDRVSEELDTLGSYDFESLGNNLAGIVTGSMNAIDEFLPKLQALGAQVWEYLGPKFQSLGLVISEQLTPAIGRLWHEFIEPLLPVLGTSLVVALGMVVDGLGLFLSATSAVINFLSANQWVIWTIVGAFGALKAALAIDAAQKSFQAGMDAINGKIDSARANINGMNTNLGSIGWMAAGAAASIGLQIIINKTLETMGVIRELGNQLGNSRAEGQKTDSAIKKLADEGKISQERYQQYIRNTEQVARNSLQNTQHMYDGFFGPLNRAFDNLFVRMSGAQEQFRGSGFGGFASGTSYAPGGMTWVGERGPELVNLPRGSQVMQSYRSRTEGASGGGASVNMYGDININNGGDEHRLLSNIGFRLELAS